MAEPTPECHRWRQDAVELAVGLIDEPQRSELLAHAARCPDCATELAELSAVSDAVLGVVPAVPAPVGFDLAVLNRIADESLRDGRPATLTPALSKEPGNVAAIDARRTRRFALAVVAAAAALVLAVGLAVGRVTAPGVGSRVAVREAILRGPKNQDTKGRVLLVRDPVVGSTRTVVVFALSTSPKDVKYRCEIVLADGTRVPAGKWTAPGGAVTWSFPVDRSLTAPKTATILVDDGSDRVWAEADLS